jgi:hypothetical protein
MFNEFAIVGRHGHGRIRDVIVVVVNLPKS